MDENRKEMGRAVSQEGHKIKFKSHLTADFGTFLCFICLLDLLDSLVIATISMETGAKSWASAGHGEKGAITIIWLVSVQMDVKHDIITEGRGICMFPFTPN